MLSLLAWPNVITLSGFYCTSGASEVINKNLPLLLVVLVFTVVTIYFRMQKLPIRGKKARGGPRYSLTFYLRIRLIAWTKRVQNKNFLVKNGLFICEFKICGPKCRSLSTANNEGNLYFGLLA